MMLSQEEIEKFAKKHEVSFDQIRKDYAISCILEALPRFFEEHSIKDVVFFGGTALNRTFLKDFRLSEDIDLLTEEYSHVAKMLIENLPEKLQKYFSQITWKHNFTRDEKWTDIIELDEEITIQLEVVNPRQRWDCYMQDSQTRPVELRYSDFSRGFEMTVPTSDSFVAMKLNAWNDRHSPRDLADLYMLAKNGFLTESACENAEYVSGLKVRVETYANALPQSVLVSWENELAHQVSSTPSAQKCFDVLRSEIAKIVK